MVSALDSGARGPDSSPGRGHCVFFGKTLYSRSASLHPGVQMGTGELLGKRHDSLPSLSAGEMQCNKFRQKDTLAKANKHTQLQRCMTL